ncbi:MAG: acyl--CoA ligase, partial [Hyphomicrobiales bacterium]|nr:acyl--CoA ligase [Hyphomicrobiales bacterium]
MSSIDMLIAREFGDIANIVHLHAQERPHHIAFIQDERRLSYGELDATMDRVATSLQRDGVRPGEAIAIVAPTSIEYAAVFLGALRAGVAVSPLAPSSTPASLGAMVEDCGARLVFVDGASAESLARAGMARGGKRRMIALDRSDAENDLDDWLAPLGTKPLPVAIKPETPFNIIYSSGTTGTPKGIVQPHQMRWAQVQRAKTFLYGRDAVALVSTPLYSNTTLVAFFPTIVHGGTLVLMGKFDAASFLALAEKHRVTHAML